MELLQPLGLIALVSLPLITALYFLRQRRPPRPVGSLMLWQKARQDVFRGRPWERFRPTWLLLVQLLVAALIGVALARPACVSVGSDAERLVIILDASASMGATDVAPTRFDAAIDRAIEAVDTAPEGSEVAVLAAGRLTRVVEPFTRDRLRLRGALNGLRERGPDTTSSSVKEALLLAMQLRQDPARGRIVLLSDGAFERAELPATGGNTDYVAVGASDSNLAITTFELRKAPSQRFGAAVVCVVTNTGSRALAGHLRVDLDAKPLEAHRVELAPGASRTFTVPVSTDRGRLTASLEHVELDDPAGGSPAKDHLASDDRAYAVIAPDLPVRVLAVGINPLTLRALAANPRLSVEPIPADAFTDATAWDVVIFEGTFPATIPQGRFLAIAPPEENPLLDYTGEEATGPTVAAWDRGHPVLYGVDLAQLRFGRVRRAVPQNGFVPLAEFKGTDGPFVLAARTPSWRGVVITTPLLETDLPLRVAFPVLLYNIVGWLSPGGEQNLGFTLSTGQPLAVPAREGETLVVNLPGAEPVRLDVRATQSDGVYLFSDTRAPGFYTAEVSGRDELLTWGVSLTNATESQIKPVSSLPLPSGAQLEASDAIERVEPQDAALVVAALALLGVEWLLFLFRNRRRSP